MAGIGFELRKILKNDSYFNLLRAFTYAGAIGSGPWILSIIAILLIGSFNIKLIPSQEITQFQISVTHLMVASLILTGFLQLAFTRYVADRLFEKHDKLVLPNFHGALMLVTGISGALGFIAILWGFHNQPILYRLLMLASLVILSQIWIATIFLAGMRSYKAVLWLFTIGYSCTIIAAMSLRNLGLEGLLSGFLIGQFILLTGMMVYIIRGYPSDHFVSFDFLKRGRMYLSLVGCGFLYNLGVWIDKIIFWYFPGTGNTVIGPLNASIIYDIPIFLAYLSIIPGMAVFLVRMETDFVEHYDRFYNAVREGGSLRLIQTIRNELVFTARQGIMEIIKIQAITMLITFAIGPTLLQWLGISKLYLPLLYVDVLAAGLQVVFLGILNVFFYLDKRRVVLNLCFLFVLANLVLTGYSLQLGALYYGYGFALSLLIAVVVGMSILDKKLDKLEYETFMLQH